MGLRGGGALMVLALVGCGPIVGNDVGGDTGSSSGRDPTEPVTTIATTVGGTSPMTTIDPSTSTSTSTTETTTSATSGLETSTGCDSLDPCGCCNFICGGCGEFGSETDPFGCDLYGQDCPAGEKCMPWANDGGNVWNASRCAPVDGNPGQIGDACTVEGSNVSGIDTCDIGLMCLWVDAETNTGSCVQLCNGSESDPTCADENARCSVELDGELPVCLPTCDPLLQNCPAGAGCYLGTGDFFVCGDAIEPTIGLEAPCDLQWSCAPGSACIVATALPECGGEGCCTAYCDTTLPEPCGPARVCNPLFEGSLAGFCAAP